MYKDFKYFNSFVLIFKKKKLHLYLYIQRKTNEMYEINEICFDTIYNIQGLLLRKSPNFIFL